MADLRAPWKIKLNVQGNGPYAVCVKLIDYLYRWTGSSWVDRDSTTSLGLPHDILAYLPTMYDSVGQLDTEASTADERQKYGIYLAKVSYDVRAPVTRVVNASYESKSPLPLDPVQTSFNGYYIINPSAILPPVETDYTTPACWGYNIITEDPAYTYSATVSDSATGGAQTGFILLEKPDSILEVSLSGATCKPFTRVRFNKSASDAAAIIRFFTGISDAVSDEDVLNPSTNPALESTYIWIRCAYFADYVQPDTFEQDLTANAEVQHKNLIVGLGDFKRFARSSEPEASAPYLPATPPRLDLLPSLASKASFPVPAYLGTYDTIINARQAPVGWFDPDIDQTQPGEGTTHTFAIPPEGNFFTSGRVFSPTIDELWVYVKKLVDGRPSDADASYSTADPASGPKATDTSRTITTDTRIAQEPNLTLTIGGSTKYGDPLTTSGDSSFVNEPRSIQYVANANIQYIANLITGTNDTNNSYQITNALFQPFAIYSSTTAWADRTRAAPGSQSTGHWAPRSNPYSLRELEAYIKNVEYNLEMAFNFIAANKASTGNTDDNDTLTANTNKQGTLYQLHVDYSPNLNSVENGDSSRWQLNKGNTTLPAGESARDGTGAILYGAGRTSPGYVNSAAAYNRFTDIPQEDVYLSAEGKWRYLFDHVRLPILDEKY